MIHCMTCIPWCSISDFVDPPNRYTIMRTIYMYLYACAQYVPLTYSHRRGYAGNSACIQAATSAESDVYRCLHTPLCERSLVNRYLECYKHLGSKFEAAIDASIWFVLSTGAYHGVVFLTLSTHPIIIQS